MNDLIGKLHQLTSQMPQWAPYAAASAAVALLSFGILVYRKRASTAAQLPAPARVLHAAAPTALAAAGPLAILGVCGMAVSLYGLYGFATDTMELPQLFAFPFMALFDVAEATCFVSLYRSAAVESTWTTPMRRTRRMAWGLVAASSGMNGAHAPGNHIAMVAFAIVPIISAKLIEHELDKQLDANAEHRDQDDAQPGLVSLVQLSYHRMWDALFTRWGLDPNARGKVSQKIRIRRAATLVRELGRALDAVDALPADEKPRRRRRTEGQVERLSDRAEKAVDAAEIAGDTAGSLMLAQCLTTRGRVGDLARVELDQPLKVAALLEDMAIVPSVTAMEAGVRAAEAEERVEAARQDLESLLTAQQAAQEAATEAEARAATAQTRTDEAKAARQEAEEAEASARRRQRAINDAATEAEAARQEAEEAAQAARERAGWLNDSLTATAQQKDEAQRLADDAGRKVQQAQNRVRDLQDAADAAQRDTQKAQEAKEAAERKAGEAEKAVREARKQVGDLQQQAEDKAKAIRGATAELSRLSDECQAVREEIAALRKRQSLDEEAARTAHAERLAAEAALRHAREALLDALTSPEPYDETREPRWTSEAKRAGWDLYQRTVRDSGVEPSDDELAAVGHRDPSTARKWLTEFRTEHARRTAAALNRQHGAHGRTTDEAPTAAPGRDADTSSTDAALRCTELTAPVPA
ncbi:DUF2637 domain-containing protein [Streptomyces platensis]|uniref:DUF2637 domain-containing protein n=1 Tax=Streptomyces platensis TaxID=58346 RepID=UPI00332D864B